MSTELAKTYAPAEVEREIAQTWDRAEAFHASPGDTGSPYGVVIPPPNVTSLSHSVVPDLAVKLKFIRR